MIQLSQSLEIEFKNLLTELEYKNIKLHFQLKDSLFFQQENHYFDTLKFALKAKQSALRIRKKANHFEFTLKQPVPEGLLETTQLLTEAEVEAALEHNILPGGQIVNLLTQMNVDPADIQFFGTLITNRAEFSYKGGLLVLDHSSYLNTEDYELEYEVTDRLVGHSHFLELLSLLQIPARKTENKIMRFYRQKYQQLSSDNI